LSDEAVDKAGNKPGTADEGAGREQGGPPAPLVEGPPDVPAPAEDTEAVAGDEPGGASDEEASEDMPTLPPASRGSVVGLRWATLPLQRRGGRGGPGGVDPDQIGPERFETGPPTVVMPTLVMPTVVMPVVLSEPQLRPEGAAIAEEPDGGARRPGRRRRRAVLMLAVIALVAAVAVGALVLAGGGSSRRAAVRTLSPQVTFEGFLAESAQAHQVLAAAVGDACRPAPPATKARQDLIIQVSRAVEMRRSVLNGIASDRQRLLAMKGGPSLVNNLDDATSASLSADQGYEAWLEDLQATGCYGAPTNDIHYRAATEASLPASVAKERVVAIWAGVASRYGLPSWTAGQL
jgi:hypothetical protein